jgi:hypothetical protein
MRNLTILPLLLVVVSSFQAPVPIFVVSSPSLSLVVAPRVRAAQPDATNRAKTRLFSTETTEWTKKRLHNTAAFRSLSLLTALTVAGFSTNSPLALLPNQAIGSIHVLSFATWFGMVAYTTFVAGITMFKNLPRQTFGRLQARLFPKYFAISSVALVLQLITLKSLSGLKAAEAHNSAKSLAVALIMTLINQFYLEPTSTKNMLER